VTKSKIMLVLTIALVLAGMLAMAIPGTASADVYPNNWEWIAPVYDDYDSYYGDYVVEYVSGSTARLDVQIVNWPYYEYGDAVLKSATLKTDWNAEIAATSLPSELDYYEWATVSFQFTVPGTDVATNAWAHSWEIVFEWQTQGYTYERYYEPWDYLGWGNGVTTSFSLDDSPIVPDSEHLFLVNYAAETITPVSTTAYDCDDATGDIVFDTAPAVGNYIYAQYTYTDYCGQGDGYNTIFWIDEAPIAPDSEIVLVYDEITGNVTQTAATDYTIDDDTGKIVFNTAPLPYQYVYASYESYGTSEWWTTFGDDNFVVLSADQGAARTLAIQYDQMWYYFDPDSVAARGYAAAAEAHSDSAWDAWWIGNFATAKTELQAAVDSLQLAKDAELAYEQGQEDRDIAWDEAYLAEQEADTAWSQAEAALVQAEALIVPNEGTYLDAQTAALNAATARINALTEAEKAKLEAQAKEAKGHGAMWANLGVFTILVGVAILLAAIGLILWAYSRLVAAKGPKQI